MSAAKRKFPRRFYFKHGAYYFVDRTNTWHPLGKDYFEALQKYAALNLNPPVQPLMETVLVRYLAEVVPVKAPSTQASNRLELELLRGVFGKMLITEVTPQDIYAYMDARGSHIRANREKSLLSHVFKYAIRWGLATDNPCWRVESFKEHPRDRYVTDEEYWLVYDAASPPVQRAMQIAVVTGLRLSDVLALNGADHVVSGGLMVRPAKTSRSTRRVLLFKWSPGLRAALGLPDDPLAAVPPGRFVCGTRGSPLSKSGFQTAWQRLQAKVFPNKEDRFTFHDLRAKAGSDSVDGKLLGHADQRTLNRHYRRKPEVVTPVEIER